MHLILECKRCANNGQDLNASCSSSIECLQYYGGPTACINGRCCTADDSGIKDGVYSQLDPYKSFLPINSFLPGLFFEYDQQYIF